MTPVCPACQGIQMQRHPAGILAFAHENACAIRASEDSRAVADSERAYPLPDRPVGLGSFSETEFVREATDTERTLLTALGHENLPENLSTAVVYLSRGIRSRTWQLPAQEIAE